MASIRLNDAVAAFLRNQEAQTTPGTYANMKSLVTRFAAYVGGNPWMSTVGSEQIEGFLIGGGPRALSRTLAESSFNVARGRINTFWGYCLRKGWTTNGGLEDVRRKDVPERIRRRFTATELVALCAAPTQPQEKILMALGCNTALRSCDITKLTICGRDSSGKVDPALRTVDLDNGWLRVKVHKTRRQDDLPITLELDAALREWLTVYPVEIGRDLEPGMFLVPAKSMVWGSTYGRLRPYDIITRPDKIYQRMVEAAGLPFSKGDGFHTLRRSFARIFYEELKRQGHPDPIRPVQAMLHHATPEMTYTYIGVELDREARNVVLRGQLFLSRLAADTSNVTQLRSADGNRPGPAI